MVTMETEDASDWSAEATEEDEDEAASGSSDEATERAEGEAEEERVELEMEENGDVADSSFVRDAPCASPRALERDDDATTATAADADANVAASSQQPARVSLLRGSRVENVASRGENRRRGRGDRGRDVRARETVQDGVETGGLECCDGDGGRVRGRAERRGGGRRRRRGGGAAV